MTRRLLLPLFVLSLLAAACSGGDSDDSVPDGADADSAATSDDAAPADGDGTDDCGQGGAFPEDPDFREAICRPLMAMTGLIGTDATIDPEWGSRISMATLNYANRDEAMAELVAVLAEIQAAG